MANIVTTESYGRPFNPVFPGAMDGRVSLRSRRMVAGDVRGIVARTISTARAAGRDYMGQSRAAAEAVMMVRPDLSFGEALDAVTRLREADTF